MGLLALAATLGAKSAKPNNAKRQPLSCDIIMKDDLMMKHFSFICVIMLTYERRYAAGKLV